MEHDDILVNPEDTVKDPPKRRRRRKLIGGTSDAPILDSTEETPEPKRKPGRPKGSGAKAVSHVADIEQGVSLLFMGAAVKFGPAFMVPSPLLDEPSQAEEIARVHEFAVQVDKYYQGLSEDSAIKRWLAKTAEASPLILATVALGRLGVSKVQLQTEYMTQLRTMHHGTGTA